jgi:hypothetical protein
MEKSLSQIHSDEGENSENFVLFFLFIVLFWVLFWTENVENKFRLKKIHHFFSLSFLCHHRSIFYFFLYFGFSFHFHISNWGMKKEIIKNFPFLFIVLWKSNFVSGFFLKKNFLTNEEINFSCDCEYLKTFFRRKVH